MRFLAEGPSIPDELLVARDEGRVVFFCGAGVSRARAGLADFVGLARAVVDRLAAAADSPARQLIEAIQTFTPIAGVGGLISADRVFSLLEREFLIGDIYQAIATSLKPPTDPDLSAHRTMLDLARGPDGRVRLVTTNFDLLFKACNKDSQMWRPPRLPDPLRNEEFFGIVHLHGHVTDDYASAAGDGFVISAAEFGRAYLSEGWATDFIRSILEKYVVVFVGYAADDPPVQYLLEALNRTPGSLNLVYAFQSGSAEDAQSRWTQKGVQSIAYEGADSHDVLWKTLSAWAERARNPDEWYDRVIGNAQGGPDFLKPHERGQVAHIASHLDGARRLATAKDAIPANWICVFDPLLRYAKPGRLGTPMHRGSYFDPFEAYGLDCDPVPSKIDPEDVYAKRDIPKGVWDCFSPTRKDRENLKEESFATLRGHWAVNNPAPVARLGHIGVWLRRVATQPASAWWASNQTGIHPDVQQQIQYALDSPDCSQTTRLAWRYIIEAWASRKGEFYLDRHQLQTTVKLDGWSAFTVREFAALHRPVLKVTKPYGGPRPPDDRPGLRLDQLVHLDVEYPGHDESVTIPDEHLSTFLQELRKNIELAVLLENEIGGYGLETLSPIEPDESRADEDDEPYARTHGISKAVLTYVDCFKRMLEADKSLAKRESLAWASNRDAIFDRLRLWACGDQRLTSAAEFVKTIRSLDQSFFWGSRNQRDLLKVLSKRWSTLPVRVRRTIERRILRGRPRWDDESRKEFLERRAWQVLDRIHWLNQQGCKLGFDLRKETARLKEEAPEWRSEFSASAADSLESRTGWVKTDTEIGELHNEPLVTLLEKAKKLSGRGQELFVERDPFAGLSAAKPLRAFSALVLAAKRNSYPEWAWRTFLNSETRRKDKPRLVMTIAERLARFPADQFAELAYPISEWALGASTELLTHREATFGRLWLRILETVKRKNSTAASSILRSDRTPEWATEALNAPVGKLAQALMNDPRKDNLKPGAGFPSGWLTRVEELLSLPDDLHRHALVMFAYNLSWFFSIDPKWTESHLLAFGSERNSDSEALWAGFFWAAKLPQKSLFRRMKPMFLSVATEGSFARRQHAESLAGILLIGWGSVADGERFVTDAEMRDVLIKVDDEFRSQMIWQLDRRAKDEDNRWSKDALAFLENVWPRQRAAKSPRVSARLCELAFSHENQFPEFADRVLPLVGTIDQDHIAIPSLRRSKDNVVDKFPGKTLALLYAVLPEDARKWPYGIDGTINRIGAAEPGLLTDQRLIELKRRWNAR